MDTVERCLQQFVARVAAEPCHTECFTGNPVDTCDKVYGKDEREWCHPCRARKILATARATEDV